MGRRNINNISSFEHEYLNKWLLRYGKVRLRKQANVPEMVLNIYLNDLLINHKQYNDNTDQMRLKVISDYIDYILNVEPRYKYLLKSYKMKGWEFGLMMGYKCGKTWHKSYKRYTYIRAIVTLINKHEELLTRLNNPIGHNKK